MTMLMLPKPKPPVPLMEDWTEDDWQMYLATMYPSDEEVLADVRKAIGVEG